MHSHLEQDMEKILLPEQSFEEVLELVQPMITAILVKCKVYKDYDYYRHIAAIAVWEAWQKADPAKGVFSSYIYTSIRGRILNELSSENKYNHNFTIVKDDTLSVLLTRSMSLVAKGHSELLEILFERLTKDEIELLQLIYIDGYNYKEIAQRLSISVDAIKKRRTRLMAKIRTVLIR